MESIQSINILLVDDRPENLDALEAVLSSPEYRLVRANSGEDALRNLLNMDFAVIVLDVRMTGLDGFETAHLIKQRERSRLTPIIFVSAYGQEEAHILEGYAMGAVDYMLKPIVPAVLRSKVAVFADLFRLNNRLRQLNKELENKNETLYKTQLDLERSHARYFDLYDLAPVGYLTINSAGLILEANTSAGRLFGLNRDSLVNQPLTGFILPEDLEIYHWYLKRILEASPNPSCEVRMLRPDKSPFWGQLEATATQEPDGAQSFRVVMNDISLRKKAEDQLRRHQEVLESMVTERTAELMQRNRDLEEFASVISHDLKEPLRKVRSFGEILIERNPGSFSETEVDYIRRMQDATFRMSKMIDDLLILSRVSIGAKSNQMVDLNEVMQEVLSILETSLIKSGGKVQVERLPIIEAEPLQMMQLFQNLVGNAIKFRRPGERPLVRVYAQELPGPDLRSSEIQIGVEDNGIGFEEAHLDILFQPFKRLVGRKEYEGTGIGLTICRKIVERHGGQITAQSTPGKGSTFFVTMPVKQPESLQVA